MKRRPYATLFLFLVSFASAAPAGEATDGGLVIFDESLPFASNESANLSADFQISHSNPNAASAWIEISLYTPPSGSPDNPGETRVIKKAVPELKYDVAAREVVLNQVGPNQVGVPIVCAAQVDRNFLFLHWERLEPTGKCRLSSSLELRPSDSGFGAEKRWFGTVRLIALRKLQGIQP